MVTVRVDEQYRIALPREARATVQPGDVLVFEERMEGGIEVLRFAKALNPFDALIDLAREEDRSGAPIPPAQFARERALDLLALERQQEALSGLAEDAFQQAHRGETIDLESAIRAAGLDPTRLPDHLTPEQEQRLIDALNG
jgi:bifunctional DNA-binding transcriptional regulator/antitoxin component of YhaV-PrlF toxin-antitoxin module